MTGKRIVLGERCPVCNLLVRMEILAKNTKGERMMVWHFDDQERECKGSHKSLKDALAIMQEADKLADGR